MAVNLSNSFRKVAGNFAAAAIGNIGMPKKIPAFADVEFGLGRRGRNKTEMLNRLNNVEIYKYLRILLLDCHAFVSQ